MANRAALRTLLKRVAKARARFTADRHGNIVRLSTWQVLHIVGNCQASCVYCKMLRGEL